MWKEQEKAWGIALLSLFVIICLGLLALISVPIYKAIASNGEAQYCYLQPVKWDHPNQPDVVTYKLWAFRPRREDRLIAANLASVVEAKAEADRLGCQIK